jgi:hypothetical protein
MRSQGAEGEGPGEFESLDYVGLIGADTLVVYDGLELPRFRGRVNTEVFILSPHVG